jgi:hypothetical protein
MDMAKKNVTIRIAKDHEKQFDSIVLSLQDHGLTHSNPTKRFLMVNGQIEENSIPKLRSTDGVVSVRPDQIFQTA